MRPESQTGLSGEAGISMTELLVVIVVIGVITTFAVLSRRPADQQLARQNVAQSLKVAFERARFDSVKRRAEASNAQAKVVVRVNSFTLTVDKNLDGVLDANDDQTTNVASSIVLDSNRLFSLPATVVFNQRGEAMATAAGGSVVPVFYVCNGDCGSPTNADANLLIVTPTGTVNLLPGGMSPPNYGVPTVTSVPAGTGVNPDVVLTP